MMLSRELRGVFVTGGFGFVLVVWGCEGGTSAENTDTAVEAKGSSADASDIGTSDADAFDLDSSGADTFDVDSSDATGSDGDTSPSTDPADTATDTGDTDGADTADLGLPDTRDASAESDGGPCDTGNRIFVQNACFQCGPAGGCSRRGSACRQKCANSSCSKSALRCSKNNVCRRICF